MYGKSGATRSSTRFAAGTAGNTTAGGYSTTARDTHGGRLMGRVWPRSECRKINLRATADERGLWWGAARWCSSCRWPGDEPAYGANLAMTWELQLARRLRACNAGTSANARSSDAHPLPGHLAIGCCNVSGTGAIHARYSVISLLYAVAGGVPAVPPAARRNVPVARPAGRATAATGSASASRCRADLVPNPIVGSDS